MKRECWGCNRIVDPDLEDSAETCPACGNRGAFGAAAKSCAWIIVVATLAVAAVLLALALYAAPVTERAAVTITQRGGWYVATVEGPSAVAGVRVGSTAAEAAAIATQLMLQHAVENPAGGSLVAPAEVRALVPAHLRDVPARREAP